MRRFNMAFLGVAIALGFQAVVVAQEPEQKLPDPARGYQWREAARKIGELSAKEIEQLAGDKILVTNQAYRQVFTPYLGDDVPLFLTSDSLLNGFHVLYEESILRMEQANARKLGRILKFVWQNLETADKAFTGKPQLVAAARARARLTIATAMQLLGEQPIPLEPSVAALVAEEVRRVESAQWSAETQVAWSARSRFCGSGLHAVPAAWLLYEDARTATVFSCRKLVAVDPLSRQQGRGVGHDPHAGKLCGVPPLSRGYSSRAGFARVLPGFRDVCWARRRLESDGGCA